MKKFIFTIFILIYWINVYWYSPYTIEGELFAYMRHNTSYTKYLNEHCVFSWYYNEKLECNDSYTLIINKIHRYINERENDELSWKTVEYWIKYKSLLISRINDLIADSNDLKKQFIYEYIYYVLIRSIYWDFEVFLLDTESSDRYDINDIDYFRRITWSKNWRIQ